MVIKALPLWVDYRDSIAMLIAAYKIRYNYEASISDKRIMFLKNNLICLELISAKL